MTVDRYILDQLYTAQTALLALAEIATDSEARECEAALKHIDKMLQAREGQADDGLPDIRLNNRC
jgi:hypothetical protein